MGRQSSAHLPLRIARLKGLALMFDGKNQRQKMRSAILDDLHTVMYMPIDPSESIEAFMTHGRNKIIKNFIQHLPNDSWT